MGNSREKELTIFAFVLNNSENLADVDCGKLSGKCTFYFVDFIEPFGQQVAPLTIYSSPLIYTPNNDPFLFYINFLRVAANTSAGRVREVAKEKKNEPKIMKIRGEDVPQR